MDLLITAEPTTTITSTIATTAQIVPVRYGSLLDNGLTVPYDNSYGIASVVARDMTLALFFMMSDYSGRPTYPRALFHCDFEDGWCPGFKPQSSSDIPWNLWKGSTPSNQTGPSHDHTRFNEYGSYIYLEASNGSIAETAVFTTPPVMMLARPNYCLRFWYNMYGAGTGSLWVYWNAAGAESIHTVVNKHAGPLSKNGSDWRESLTTLPATSWTKHYRPVRFEFRGIRGASFKSDIAIDDIVLLPGKCNDIYFPKTATTMTYRGITTQSTIPTLPPTTTRSWMADDPNYSPCGQHDYFHIRREMCCGGNVRKKTSNYQQCCGNRVFHIIHNVCCGGSVLWLNSHGCCQNRNPYRKRDRACCYESGIYNVLKQECVNRKIRKRRKPLPNRRGKRSVITRWGFF